MDTAIHNRQGERLDYSWAGDAGARDVCVIGHGVTANKDRAWAVALQAELHSRSLASIRFSFSGNGDSGGDFRESTVHKEVDDLAVVIDALSGRRIAYAGHSMGAAVGVLAATRDPRIELLVSLAGMVDTRDFAQRKFGSLVPGRDCMWDKPECPLSQTFLDDMGVVGSVLAVSAEIRIPWLLVHGSDDEVVPIRDSLDVLCHSRGDRSFVELPGCDHVFSGDAEGRMARVVADWLEAHVG